MSIGRYQEILRQAREELSPEEQKRLANALVRPISLTNGKNDPRSLHDALRDRGIIGSITDAPADLGTNPRHMEGFGQDAR